MGNALICAVELESRNLQIVCFQMIYEWDNESWIDFMHNFSQLACLSLIGAKSKMMRTKNFFSSI